MFAREHFACASEPCGNFVGDQEDMVFIAEPADFSDIALRGDDHAPCSLNKGFYDYCSNFFMVISESIFHFFDAGKAAGPAIFPELASIAIGRRRLEGLEQKRSKGIVEYIDPANAYCTEGITVICVIKGEKTVFPCKSPVPPILEGHFKGNLNSCRAVIRIKNFGRGRSLCLPKGLTDDIYQFLRQLYGRRIAQSKHCAMGYFAELVPDCVIYLLFSVAEDIHP